ncbi:MAG: hypothetical protein BWY72_01365 [Bacteroidetes bacterium ADurb.Bin416]|nr:MAG: hypothetical protein BWY72_01365 [Bacteroidetes bacterium ADurb.Bin416]
MRQPGSPFRKSAPSTKACANPLGTSWILYSNRIPKDDPSPSSSLNIGRSLGVEMTNTSFMPANIKVDNG